MAAAQASAICCMTDGERMTFARITSFAVSLIVGVLW
jgi:hypothetical protein